MTLRRRICIRLLGSLLIAAAPTSAVDLKSAQADLDAGRAAQAQRQFAEIVEKLDSEGKPAEAADVRRMQAAALQATGEYRKATTVLMRARDDVGKAGDKRRIMLVSAAIGNVLAVTEPALAEAYFTRALEAAAELGEADSAFAASVHNDLANLLSDQGRTEGVDAHYATAIRLADAVSDKQLAATARVNQLLTNARTSEAQLGEGDFTAARRRLDALPPSHSKASLLAALGAARRTAHQRFPAGSPQLLGAFDDFTAARQTADQIGDKLAAAYAWGYIGELYLSTNQLNDALTALRKAQFNAQGERALDAQWRWQLQIGRVLYRQGKTDEAVAAYQRAILSIKPIRQDLTISLGGRRTGSTFRNAIGPAYFELADLLLRRAAAANEPVQQQADLRAAIEAIEQFKSAELEDYFRDDCTSIAQSHARAIDEKLVRTAVVYFIPLNDRLETIVSTPAGRMRYQSPVGVTQLSTTARELRELLEYDMDFSYRGPAAQLHEWLIKPLLAELRSQQIDTLIFVPDGELRTVPMAALYEKSTKRHLIQDFAIAISPGLTLMEDQPVRRADQVSVLAAGVTDAVQDFPALPNVTQEIRDIQNQYVQTQPLLNGAFVKDRFVREMSRNSYNIVHVASHGEFLGDASKTFLLTHDAKLNLNELQELIQPSRFRERPIDLLALSACKTASGADGARAALGLGGIAVKAGARSALATLWAVDDAATSEVISGFYQGLRDRSDWNKAQALQAAQVRLIDEAGKTLPYNYKHPRKWAPYLIIGNWK